MRNPFKQAHLIGLDRENRNLPTAFTQSSKFANAPIADQNTPQVERKFHPYIGPVKTGDIR